jgi:hypothetical protein
VEAVNLKYPTKKFDVTIPLPGKAITIGNDWTIAAVEMSAPDIHTTFKWNVARAEFPPDPQAARSR